MSETKGKLPMTTSLHYRPFTQFNRGPELILEFLRRQDAGTFSWKNLSIKACPEQDRTYLLKVFAEDRQIGNHIRLWERFAAIAHVYQQFMHVVETAATEASAAAAAEVATKRKKQLAKDKALCERVLSRISADTDTPQEQD